METFLIAFGHRVLSGLQSFFGYSKKYNGLWFVAILLISFLFLVSLNSWIFFLYFIVNVGIVLMKTISFDRKVLPSLDKYKDIHLWETLLTGLFVVYMTITGYNILLICCSVYPALILHKGLINMGNKLSFFDSRTDDPTGKTYAIPLLGIKVPRETTKNRLIFAILSVIIAIIVIVFELNISLNIFR